MTLDIGIIIVAGLGFVAWLIRLEAKVLYQDKDIERLQTDHSEHKAEIWNKMDDMKLTLTSILQSLAKIEGKLEGHDGHGRRS